MVERKKPIYRVTVERIQPGEPWKCETVVVQCLDSGLVPVQSLYFDSALSRVSVDVASGGFVVAVGVPDLRFGGTV